MAKIKYFLSCIFILLGLFNSQAFSENSDLKTICEGTYEIKEKYLRGQMNLILQNKAIQDQYTFSVLGENFVGFPNVFSPKVCHEEGFFVERIPIHEGDSVLEIGSGTGFFPVFAIKKQASQVIATDINPDAVKNTLANAKLHQMESQIKAIQSDIFNALPPDLKFDVIYWNIPFTPTHETNLSLLDLSVFDPGNAFLERYLKECASFLKPDGRAYVGYSSTHGNVSKLKALAKKYNLNLTQVAQTGSEDSIIVELFEFKPINKK